VTKIPHIPTKAGDVLIIWTEASFRTYAVGLVTTADSQDFREGSDVKYLSDRASALAEAKARVAPAGRIFLVDFDNAKWSKI
jgi:hypothetical protein